MTADGGAGDFMQNLTLERKMPTLCWLGDLCGTNQDNQQMFKTEGGQGPMGDFMW